MMDNRQKRVSAMAAALLVLVLAGAPCRAMDAVRTADLLGGADRAGRARGLAALKASGQSLMPGLAEALRAGPLHQRRGAAIGLSLLPLPGLTAGPLIRGLADEDPVVRGLCAHGLGRIGEPAAEDTARLLTHSDNRVRVGAALALSKMGVHAIPALKAMLELRDPAVTARAAWLLGSLGRDALPAVPALIRALGTDDMRVVHVVAEALDAIGPDPATVAFELTMLGSGQTNCPVTRVGREAAPTLVRILARPGTPMAQFAFYTLARMGREAEPALRETLSTGTPNQRTAAALLLTGIDPGKASTLPEDLRRALSGAMKNQ